ncbi:MAG: transcription antitermination factor NusB [Verrucomicrobiaceae bacterium]|nr:transcription antitermination factor NusB [Verrucomicrobiaceae bacterium]
MPDTSRHRIREAVVQFLYAIGPADELPETPNPAILSLLLESARDKSSRARARAVVHLQQGREKIKEGLAPLVDVLAQMESAEGEGELIGALRTWAAEEEALCQHLDGLRQELNGNRDATRLTKSLNSPRIANRSALVAAASLLENAPQFPALESLHREALALRETLVPLGERLALALGDELSSLPELKSIARAEQSLTATRKRIEDYYQSLRLNLHKIDAILVTVLENYAPERLDRVDRAILRLGAFELLHDENVPPAVAINEAIELAREFGTTESPGFVNAILDRMAKEQG